MPYLVTRWFDAYVLRKEFIDYEIKITGPFTEAAKPTIDQMVLNATEKYDDYDFEASIQEFEEVKEYIKTLQTQDNVWLEKNIANLKTDVENLKLVIYILIIVILLLIFLVIRQNRKLQRLKRSYSWLTLLSFNM